MTRLEKHLAVVDKEVDVEKLAFKLGCKTSLAKEFIRYSLANAILFDEKQMDYGPGNISKFGDHGVVVRTSDKIERLAHLYGQGGSPRKAKNESIEDTFRDIANYGIIGLIYRAGLWEGSMVTKKKAKVKVEENLPLATTDEQPNNSKA